MNEGAVHLEIRDQVARITFDRPAARNAMTWAMYQALSSHCAALASKAPDVRAVVICGGREAFVAGTDISQFSDFADGEDGIAYERKIDECITGIEKLPMPTLAVIEGWAVGGGLVIATACDFRIATANARFGAPIAATVGNTLSIANFARLRHAWGVQRARRMVLLAEVLRADEALACGFLHQICEAAELDIAIETLTSRLTSLAPVTQAAAKEALRRIAVEDLPRDDDLVRLAYSSKDFKSGVAAFVARKSPEWSGS